MVRKQRRVMRRLKSFLHGVREFCNGYAFYVWQTLAACLFVTTKEEVNGVLFFVALICALLVVCEDILPTTLPFLLTCTIATNCYDSYSIFMPYAVYVPVVLSCLLFHFVVYPKSFKTGKSGTGLLAVGIAVTLGGVGRFSIVEYVYGSYYILGLGLGLYGAYLLVKREYSAPRNYDFAMRFSVLMLLTAFVCAFMIFFGYIRYKRGEIPRLYPEGFSRNNLSTILMFCMPFALYPAQKRPLLAALCTTCYAAIAATTSRGGLLFGGVELFVCFLYWIFSATGKKRIRRLIFSSSCISVLLLVFGNIIADVLLGRLLNMEHFKTDARRVMFWQAIERFTNNPVVGSGLLDRTLVYEIIRKQGALTWYHMMLPQIVGSMGLVGIVCYGFCFAIRLRLVFNKPDRWSATLGISYLGIFLMSQVNPGEFCPLPFGLLAVILFILQERRLEYAPPTYFPTERLRRF